MDIALVVVLRATQALLQAMPTLLVGVLLAGVLGCTRSGVRVGRYLKQSRWMSIPTAWGLAIILPVCSLGMLPLLRWMRESRASPAAMTVFAVSAGGLTPLSAIYLLDRLGPGLLAVVLFTSAVHALLWALLGGLLLRESQGPGCPPRTGDLAAEDGPFLPRLISGCCRVLDGRLVVLVMLASLGNGVVAAMLSPGSLEDASLERSWKAVAVLAAAMSASWIQPEQAALMSAELRESAMPMTLLIPVLLGSGLSLALPLALGPAVGIPLRRSLVRTAATFALASALMAFAIVLIGDTRLRPAPVPEPEGSHAFDVLTTPYHLLGGGNALPSIRSHLSQVANHSNLSSLLTLAALLMLRVPIDRWAGKMLAASAGVRPRRQSAVGRMAGSRIGRAVGVVGTGLLLLQVAMLAFYAPPQDLLDELRRLDADLMSDLRRGKDRSITWRLDRISALLDRLGPACWVRWSPPPPDLQEATRSAREAVGRLRERHDVATGWALSIAISNLHRVWTGNGPIMHVPALPSIENEDE